MEPSSNHVRKSRNLWNASVPLFFCLLGCLNGFRQIDAVPISTFEVVIRAAPSPEERLSEIVDDISAVAAVARGVSIAQSIRDRNFTLDQLAGELLLGPEKEMSSLEDVNVPEFMADIAKIEKTVKDRCGNGCGDFEGKAVSDGVRNLNSILNPQLREILKNENAFEEMEATHEALYAIWSAKGDLEALIEDIYTLGFGLTDMEGAIGFVRRSTERMKSLFAAEPSMKKLQRIIGNSKTLPGWIRTAFVKGIDTLLGLESIRFAKHNDEIANLKTSLKEILPKAKPFSDVLSTERINRIKQRLDEVNPILDSSIRHSRHPLLRFSTDFENNIQHFEKKFLEESKETELKSVLEPINTLIASLKPLETSWNSTKIDGIEANMENFRKNLDDVKAGMIPVSALFPLEKCIENLTLESKYDFNKLREVKRKFSEAGWGLDLKEPVDMYFDVVNSFRELSSQSDDEIRRNNKVLLVSYIRSGLTDVIRISRHVEWARNLEWLGDATLKTVFSDLGMRPLIAALDCLEANNVLSMQENPVQMPSLSRMKPDDPDLKAVVSAANAVKGLIDEWKRISEKTSSLANDVEMQRMEFAQNDTGKVLLSAELLNDLEEIYEKRDHLEILVNAAKAVDDEIASLTDAKEKAAAAREWNEEVREILGLLPTDIESSLSQPPEDLEDVMKTFYEGQKLKFPQIDTRHLQKTLEFVRDGRFQKSLKAIGSLDLNRPDSKMTLNSASIAFISALNYFEKIEEEERKKIIRDIV